jgi:hypothetical protein
MRPWLLFLLLLISGFYLVIRQVGLEFVIPLDTPFVVKRIAHAGGGIARQTYTNSYEALEHNHERGFRYFELDFSFTSDGQLVCIHDWKNNFEHVFGFAADNVPTLAEFIELATTSARFENCTLDGVAQWMASHREAILVTDIKENNLAGLELIRVSIAGSARRVIPQVYFPENFQAVRKLGFESIIWTLYRYGGSEEEVLKHATEMDPPIAVTMPVSRAETGLPKRLAKRNIPSYVHTINSADEALRLSRRFRVTEIYTDFLPPE